MRILTARFPLRIRPKDREMIEAAAEIEEESPSAFTRAAAIERARRVLADAGLAERRAA